MNWLRNFFPSKKNNKVHWEDVYGNQDEKSFSWYQESSSTSLRLIREYMGDGYFSMIDVGSGSTRLIDELCNYENIAVTALDISNNALLQSQQRLGEKGRNIKWVNAGVTDELHFDEKFDLWHDRALFHFLTEPEERSAYMRNVKLFLKPDGKVIISVFSDKGPKKCSNLTICRYKKEELSAEFGKDFQLLDSFKETHLTPSGVKQNFLYCVFQRKQ